jgi:hypothetical protein
MVAKDMSGIQPCMQDIEIAFDVVADNESRRLDIELSQRRKNLISYFQAFGTLMDSDNRKIIECNTYFPLSAFSLIVSNGGTAVPD